MSPLVTSVLADGAAASWAVTFAGDRTEPRDGDTGSARRVPLAVHRVGTVLRYVATAFARAGRACRRSALRALP